MGPKGVRGSEPYAPGQPWYDANTDEFVIRKTGVYTLKAQVAMNYTSQGGTNWTGNIYVAFLARQPNSTLTEWVSTEKFNHPSYLNTDSFTLQDTMPLLVGTRVWLVVRC